MHTAFQTPQLPSSVGGRSLQTGFETPLSLNGTGPTPGGGVPQLGLIDLAYKAWNQTTMEEPCHLVWPFVHDYQVWIQTAEEEEDKRNPHSRRPEQVVCVFLVLTVLFEIAVLIFFL